MRRRTYLAVMGAGLLTGCGGLGGNKFQQADSSSAISNVKNATGLDEGETGKSARGELKKGEYTSFGFQIKKESQMDFTLQVVSGGKIDVYVMTIDEFNEFQQEPNIISAKREFSNVKTIDTQEVIKPDGYNIVFDNTYQGDAKPSDDVVLQFEFKLTDVGTPGASN